jgi:hypothetical protein
LGKFGLAGKSGEEKAFFAKRASAYQRRQRKIPAKEAKKGRILRNEEGGEVGITQRRSQRLASARWVKKRSQRMDLARLLQGILDGFWMFRDNRE